MARGSLQSCQCLISASPLLFWGACALLTRVCSEPARAPTPLSNQSRLGLVNMFSCLMNKSRRAMLMRAFASREFLECTWMRGIVYQIIVGQKHSCFKRRKNNPEKMNSYTPGAWVSVKPVLPLITHRRGTLPHPTRLPPLEGALPAW